ncbi:ribose 5-phosphate isomerase B [Hymenobacter busanensis]|uniref:Ribose 5-phosphate isomerase B n=1 Tax=Hymenobacter busanensis TaxID=2607656 RepID=A0A7L4ZYY0_9BACT|nr:ribose 5-phosphate isomerase B [Hymenobacter busanensis]KAA9333058.1 ribose 5-phosphate isomerase B [Hymenobacter busanensis]QHJ08267.1 ribose 5-phosphate isomerase B [Hymenobacter busanensis]
MKLLAIGSDHAGFAYKEMLKPWLTEQGYELRDFGTHSADSADYADFAHPLAAAVASGEVPRGILICGSANGVCITANKHKGVRAALAWLPELAELARQHNDANVLCLPARFVSEEQARQITRLFLDTAFEGGRHATRVGKIDC